MQQVQPHEWRRFGFGGPPEPWEHGAQRDLDRVPLPQLFHQVGPVQRHRRVLAERLHQFLVELIERERAAVLGPLVVEVQHARVW